MANAYKSLKEDFVSNHSGGSIFEINLVTAVAPAAYLLWAALQSRYAFFKTSTLIAYLADFFINVGGLLLALTTYAQMPGLLLTLFICPAMLILLAPTGKTNTIRSTPRHGGKTSGELSDYPRRPYLTVYRGGMMVVTAIAILAVDFKVFPRRFAKVETWGTSLMDVGVGSFVFAAGLASSKSFTMRPKNPSAKQQQPFSVVSQAITAIRQSLPLLILGVIRLISVKNLDYAEHVSEYGVHWNFFFTLAAIPLALCFIQPLMEIAPGLTHGYLGLLLVTIYELLLQNTSLKAWVLTAPRVGFLTQNKEGIFSCVGYLAIFLLGIETGNIVLPRRISEQSLLYTAFRVIGLRPEKRSSRILLLISLVSLSATYSLLLLPFYTPRAFPWLSIPVSRRLANAPYVIWIGAYNTTQLLMFVLVETCIFPNVHKATTATAERKATDDATPAILEDYNSGGLLVFLIANLGTGLVNLSINTLEVGNIQAVGILVIYMALVTLLAKASRGIKLKI